ncbi:MAG: chromate transporter [Sphaerochaetaceae bacterium]
MNQSKTSLVTLFATFAKIGVMTFGGGYAMLPMLQDEIVNRKHWCSEENLLDYFAVGQCTPGIIAINTATFIGYKTRGNIGGIVATLGMVFPSLVIISVVYHVLEAFQSNIYVQYALSGIQVAVAALISCSVIKLAKKSLVDAPAVLLAVAVLASLVAFGLSPIIFILVGIAFGLTVSGVKERKKHGADTSDQGGSSC